MDKLDFEPCMIKYEDKLEELKNELYCQLFHQTDENAKIIVADFYKEHTILKDWIEKNRDKLIYS